MNGTTAVTTTGDYMRCTRGRVVKAGSGGVSAGTITLRQASTTANVFAQMPANLSQTTIGAFTVPNGFRAIMKRYRATITRANGSPGSATVTFRTRRYGEVFNASKTFELQTGSGTTFREDGGLTFPAGTDIKYRIDSVSDNNTVAEGVVEYQLIRV